MGSAIARIHPTRRTRRGRDRGPVGHRLIATAILAIGFTSRSEA